MLDAFNEVKSPNEVRQAILKAADEGAGYTESDQTPYNGWSTSA
ncbi:hypothetical protein [Rhizobium tubonense]|nr:hypothetical protein [Rhizobium tubonense]